MPSAAPTRCGTAPQEGAVGRKRCHLPALSHVGGGEVKKLLVLETGSPAVATRRSRGVLGCSAVLRALVTNAAIVGLPLIACTIAYSPVHTQPVTCVPG